MRDRFIGLRADRIAGLFLRSRLIEQLSRARDVLGTLAAGEQAVVADAVEAAGEHMDQEAADELAGGEGHELLPFAPVSAIVLPLEGNGLAVESEEPAVGDGDAVGVARQIGEHRLRPAERALGVDDPFGFAQRREICREGLRVVEMSVVTEEAQEAGRARCRELLQEKAAEQA